MSSFPLNGDGESDFPEMRSFLDGPAKKKRGRPTNEERAARAAQAAKAGGSNNATSDAETKLTEAKTEVTAFVFRDPEPDPDALERLKKVPGPFHGQQANVMISADFTESIRPHLSPFRAGLGGLVNALGESSIARKCITVNLSAFNTHAFVIDIGRGRVTLPNEIELVTGTYAGPLMAKTAAMAKAFAAHVVASGGVVMDGLLVVLSDFWFNDYEREKDRISGWRKWLKAHNVVPVAAMTGEFNESVASAFSDLPPLPVEKVDFGPLFSSLANSMTTSLSGRGRLEALLRELIEGVRKTGGTNTNNGTSGSTN